MHGVMWYIYMQYAALVNNKKRRTKKNHRENFPKKGEKKYPSPVI